MSDAVLLANGIDGQSRATGLGASSLIIYVVAVATAFESERYSVFTGRVTYYCFRQVLLTVLRQSTLISDLKASIHGVFESSDSCNSLIGLIGTMKNR